MTPRLATTPPPALTVCQPLANRRPRRAARSGRTTPRAPGAGSVDGIALALVLVTGGATFVALFRFFQFIAWT